MLCPRCNGTAVDPQRSTNDLTGSMSCALCRQSSGPHPPSGCHWCGLAQNEHYIRWHRWTPPTQEQIKTRMRSRRTARLQAAPPKYHAATRYTGSAVDPDDEGYALCSDCGTDNCARYQRIQTRRARHLTSPAAQAHGTGGWGANPNWPF